MTLCGVVLMATTASSHHSLSAMYDQTRRVSVDAVVVHFHFVNPHPYLVAETRAPNGSVQRWRFEMDNRHELVAIGITTLTLKPGDRVIASGSPGRNADNSLYAWAIERPADGFRYEQVGGTPRIVSPPR